MVSVDFGINTESDISNSPRGIREESKYHEPCQKNQLALKEVDKAMQT